MYVYVNIYDCSYTSLLKASYAFSPKDTANWYVYINQFIDQ